MSTRPRSSDAADYEFLTTAGARLQVSLDPGGEGRPELRFFGNRAGLLSLANVLLWMVGNAWRREFLSFGELPFCRLEGGVALCLRITADSQTGRRGRLSLTDRDKQLEWEISEDHLLRVALTVHHLASSPEHEYDRLLLADDSVAEIHIRMTDAADWLRQRSADAGGPTSKSATTE